MFIRFIGMVQYVKIQNMRLLFLNKTGVNADIFSF